MYLNIKIHIVTSYESMIPIIQECIPKFPELDINYSIGDLDEGLFRPNKRRKMELK
ncbi:hypothetical protein [Neobacillus soli]|uniref:hypothetical protein n=1 Tax=Neobacillus soli TaxID=220688 RepID=UPI000A8F25D9|nr:hypothetical protein [Neobacillus soli]